MVCVLDVGFSWDREEMKLGDSSLIVQGPEKHFLPSKGLYLQLPQKLVPKGHLSEVGDNNKDLRP